MAVDPGTGHVELLDCLVVEDVGRIVNPLTLHGQAIGGAVQGLGGAFLENLVYDGNGQLLAGNLADYLIPTATDFTRIRAIALENHPSPSNPLGVKGAGEGAIIPMGGLMANAVANALASFGASPNELPLSPARVWRMAQREGARNAGMSRYWLLTEETTAFQWSARFWMKPAVISTRGAVYCARSGTDERRSSAPIRTNAFSGSTPKRAAARCSGSTPISFAEGYAAAALPFGCTSAV